VHVAKAFLTAADQNEQSLKMKESSLDNKVYLL
jgi:hypothetical protein